MSSERQIIANRINGAKSHGPITPEGRLTSSRNSITQNGEPVRPCPRNAETAGSTSGRYVLLSEAIILQGESAERFKALHDSLIEEFQPETPTQVGLVETMVVCRWRLMRIWILENSAVAHEIRKQAVANQQPYPHNRLVEDEATGQRYETRYNRQLSRAIQRFNEVRAHREKKLFSTNEPNLDGSL